MLLSSLELSDTEVYDSEIRARLGTTSPKYEPALSRKYEPALELLALHTIETYIVDVNPIMVERAAT